MNLTTTSLQLGLVLASLPALAGPPAVVAPAPATAIEFVANQRQWEKPVLFAADVPSGRLFLEHGRLVQALYDGKQVEELHHKTAAPSGKERIRAHAYSTTFVGANMAATVNGEAQLPGLSNYFLGNDESRWASNVPGYGEVRYKALYPGIDLHFYSKERVLEYDFEVAAGADAKRIALRYAGQTKLSVVNGALHIGTSVGTVVEQRPYAYQLVDGKRQRVTCEYALGAGNTVKFSLPQDYNHALPLVIDPVLVYSSFSGSSASNYGYTATYDSLGNLYAGGVVFSLGFPTTVGAYSAIFRGSQDIGIIKYNPSAATGPASRLYATYIGGNSDDHPHSLVVDGANNLVILGSTSSSDYPTSTTGYDRVIGGTSDIILSKLNSTGSTLLGSTFLGGSAADGQVTGALNHNYGDSYRGDVTTDRLNNIYIASITQSTNFPTTSQAFQRTSGGGASDAVVAKLNPGLTSLLWSNYLGGSSTDAGYSIQLDSVNNVFVGGGTVSGDFPGRIGGFRSLYSGGTADGFVSRISANGDDLAQSTYLGTSSYDQTYFVQLNKRGEVYAYGQTDGVYPITTGLYGNPNSRQFIQKLNSRLSAGIYSTVIGNGTAGQISPTAFLVDNCGQIVISGWGGNNAGMPVTPNAIQSTGGSSSFGYFYIAQLSGDAQNLVYATFFGNGSAHVDGGTSRFDKRGVIYQSMCVGSGVLPTTPNAWSPTNGSSWNNAAFKIDVLQLTANFVPTISPSTTIRQANLCAPATFYFNRPNSAGTSTLWNFGNGQTSTQANNATTTYTTPGKYAVRLTVFDTNNCLQSVSSVDTVTVYAVPQPRVAASSRQTICVGSSVTLSATNQATATPNVTYTWTAPGQPARTGPSITVSPTTTTKYTITISTPLNVGGCSATDTVTVKVIPRLTVSAGPARTICAGTPTTLTVADFGTGSTYTWTAPGQPTLTGRTVTVSPTTNVRYLVRVVNPTGCLGRDSVQFTIPTPPVLAATASTPNLVGKPVTFVNTTTGATSYRWDFGDNTPTSTEVNPTHVYTAPSATTPYQARLTAIYGPNCEASLIVPVPVRGFDNPNIITPNGDKLNDTFRPFVTTEKVNIQIFNRWGRLVYEQKDYAGTWGDETTPVGLYYYRLDGASGESWKGWLEVVK
ncbi:PKD domain-containing protein [Hymenobacter negativus]|uniref:PKD domain-containing protein n=1 Tax=Hymenobacter negativus TaxID=2795026 RepID=A0ABS3QAY8_9BACT|nr:PKD domain-containing protein [Hymenobacter negativus]MBO2008415.1 PKD domain-containing protein [Hymenobacter negativus]